ncbi:phage tail tape measure protein [Clostridium perfringens]|uniref:phage tail tape measure protein n=1 Tax=Clostridium perfringens TaxID=1502 RepID=UPI0018E4819C|nr:phage tail tape measure protein [Clostridium perfringens]MBI6052354.1 phage tail tape measure protein [Clostridium perfringens]
MVIGANVKIGANSSSFQKQMKEMAQELKKVGSSYNLANTQAKLFGNRTDLLKSQQAELTSKMKIQNNMITAQANHLNKLNGDLDKQKSRQGELAKKIDDTTRKYKESVSATGKNSEESKKLQKELKELKEDYAKNDKAIDSNISKLSNAEIKLNNSKKALLENQKALETINKELDKSKIDKFSEGIGKVGEKSGNLSEKMKPASTVMVGFGTAATFASVQFQDSMAKVSTISDDTQVPLEELKKGIMNLSNQTGISSDEIANNVYDAISAGQQTGDAVNFVSNSTKLAKAGFAEAGQSLDLLTTIMNSYGLEANKVGEVSDMLIQTQNVGKVTVGELSEAMGKVIPTANANNVSLAQVASGYAQLTSKGIKAAESTTYMNSMFNELGKSGTVAQKALKEATGKTFPELMKSGKSVGDVLNSMNDYAKKNGKSLADMFGSAEAGKAALVLSGNQGKDFNEILKGMQNSAGATDKAFDKVSNTTAYSLTVALNQGKNALIEFGDVIAPFISIAAKGLSSVTTMFNGMSKGQKELVVGFGATFIGTNLLLGGFSKLTKGIQSNIKFTKDMIKATKDGVGKLKEFGKATKEGTNIIGKFGKGIITGTKTVASFTKSIILNTAQGVKNGAIWVANKTKMLAYKTAQLAVTGATKAMTLAQKGLNIVMAMNPIVLVIGLLVALGATFVILYNKCEWFRNSVNSVWEKITGIFTKFDNFLTGVFSKDWTESFGLLGVPLNSFLGTVGAIWNGVKGVFNGILTFLHGVFTGNWKEIFQGLSNIVSSIFGTIGGVIKAPINAAISGINWVISKINTISFDVPSWIPGIGGSHFGINLPTIPALAEGGVVTKATMALIGEGKEHEAVIPLSKLDKLVTSSVKSVLNSYANKKDKYHPIEEPKIFKIIVPIDSKVIAEVIVDSNGNVLTKKSKSRAIVRGGIA